VAAHSSSWGSFRADFAVDSVTTHDRKTENYQERAVRGGWK